MGLRRIFLTIQVDKVGAPNLAVILDVHIRCLLKHVRAVDTSIPVDGVENATGIRLLP